MKKFLIALCFVLPVLFFVKSAFAEEQNVNNLLVVKYIYSSTGEVYTMRCSPSRAVYGDVFPSGYPNVSYTSDGKMRINFGISTYIERFHEDGSYGGSETAMGFTFPVYQVYNGVVSGCLYNDPLPPTIYDESIGVGSEFFIVQQGNAFDTQKWGIFWKTPNCSSCQLMISGGLKTDTFDVSVNSSLWVNPSVYASDNSNIVLFLTPLDSDGNWGNTMSISHYYHSNLLTQGVENAIQLFNGYIAKADNIPDTNIIGIDTVDVVDYSGRPDTNGIIDTITRVNTSTIYSPVYNTTNNTVNDIFEEYITNETVYNSVTNNYYTTNNYINKNTSISINLGGGDSDSKENLLIKFLNSRKWFNDTSDEVLDSLKDLKGTPFEFIFDTVSTCLVALVGIAIVLLLVKVVGFFV